MQLNVRPAIVAVACYSRLVLGSWKVAHFQTTLGKDRRTMNHWQLFNLEVCQPWCVEIGGMVMHLTTQMAFPGVGGLPCAKIRIGTADFANPGKSLCKGSPGGVLFPRSLVCQTLYHNPTVYTLTLGQSALLLAKTMILSSQAQGYVF